jgi:hypothetical protein
MPDLMIGSRRTGPPRTWRAAFFAGLLVMGILIVAYFIYRRSVSYEVPPGSPPRAPVVTAQPEPGSPPRLEYGEASLTWAGPIAVVRAAGDPHTIGAAHGRLLAGRVVESATQFQSAIDHAVGPGGWFGGWTYDMRVAWRHRFLDDGIPDLHRRAIAGLVRGAAATGARLSYEDVLRQQAALDVGAPAPWSHEVRLRRISRGLTIVMPQPGPTTGRVWVGRSFALPGVADGGDAAARLPVVSIVRPTGKKAWAGVGWPSLVGVVTGINQDGIVVTVTLGTGGDVQATRTARPVTLLARDVLERSATLDEAVKLVTETPTLGAASFTIVDGKTGRWAVVERSPTHTAVRRDPAEAAVGDVMVASVFTDDPENDRAARISPAPARARRASRLARTAPADIAAAAAILRDDRGADDGPLPAGHRGAVDDASAVQVVLIDPTAMVLWVSETGAASGRMRAFDLRHDLLGEGVRPTPPPDIAAEGEVERDRDAAVRAARAELRMARRLLRDDAPVRASERVARALAHAPSLPEALALAGELARRRGDHDAARAYWQRWLEAGPDDPAMEQEVRAALGM